MMDLRGTYSGFGRLILFTEMITRLRFQTTKKLQYFKFNFLIKVFFNELLFHRRPKEAGLRNLTARNVLIFHFV